VTTTFLSPVYIGYALLVLIFTTALQSVINKGFWRHLSIAGLICNIVLLGAFVLEQAA